jgi:hypothetical protein
MPHHSYPAWFNARYALPGHTHEEVDQMFRVGGSGIPNRSQRVPFPSVTLDNAPSEFKSNVRSLL